MLDSSCGRLRAARAAKQYGRPQSIEGTTRSSISDIELLLLNTAFATSRSSVASSEAGAKPVADRSGQNITRTCVFDDLIHPPRMADPTTSQNFSSSANACSRANRRPSDQTTIEMHASFRLVTELANTLAFVTSF
jgi:hypothetical protein